MPENEIVPVLNTSLQSYQYKGCVSSVQAEGSGLPEVLLPNATVMVDPNHAYVKRLVARGLLVKVGK